MSTQPNNIVISVQDDGIGLHSDEQKQLFQRFSQVDREHREQQGLGLGLAIADALVRLHGGTITLKSVEGKGSTFTITLPVR